MTYSIVARHPRTHELGVAVQSHYFSVGSVVTWAAPGLGAIATQAASNIAFGPHGLDRLGAGASAPTVLATLLAEDPGREHRQVAIVDASGEVAAHTGANTIPDAGHVTGTGVSCQGNIMVTPEIWGAMLAAYEAAIAADAPLAAALLDALDAAEALGGDARGRQSAALLVVPATGERWERVVELRVEDHADPLVELRRLLGIHTAYALLTEADELDTAGNPAGATVLLDRAYELMPDSHELRFWFGLHLFTHGDAERGLALVRQAIAGHPGWGTLLPRLPETTVPGVGALRVALESGS